tara:strand:+ start:118 stop:753 length:636 start_codon:yes stop_codon:yes gene_type:complete
MMPLTESIPKPLIPVLGKPILFHIIEALPEVVDELIIVVGYKGKEIEKYCQEFIDRKCAFIFQEELTGTAGAVRLCEAVLEERFMVIPADDIHGKEAIEKAVGAESAILVSRSDTPERFGVVEEKEGVLVGIEEKPEKPKSNLVSTGAMVLGKDIFDYEAPQTASGEYYLPDMLKQYAKDHTVSVIEQDLWIPLGYPEDVERAEEILRDTG